MRVFFLFASILASVLNVIAEEASGPVITVRKGTSVVVEVKEIGGSAGASASDILRNDIQLSGALSSGDSSAATVTLSGSASASNFNALAAEKTGGVVLQKAYPGNLRRAVHQFTNDLVETLTAQKGIALSKVAFVSDRSGHKEIYTWDYVRGRKIAADSWVHETCPQ